MQVSDCPYMLSGSFTVKFDIAGPLGRLGYVTPTWVRQEAHEGAAFWHPRHVLLLTSCSDSMTKQCAYIYIYIISVKKGYCMRLRHRDANQHFSLLHVLGGEASNQRAILRR